VLKSLSAAAAFLGALLLAARLGAPPVVFVALTLGLVVAFWAVFFATLSVGRAGTTR